MKDPYPLIQSLYTSLGISDDSAKKENLNAQILWHSTNNRKTYYESALAAYDLYKEGQSYQQIVVSLSLISRPIEG